jgi:hypothetical protein
MRAGALFVDVIGLVVTVLLLLALRWAAIERGRIHREWARLERELGRKVSQSIDWCMAMAAAAGCA